MSKKAWVVLGVIIIIAAAYFLWSSSVGTTAPATDQSASAASSLSSDAALVAQDANASAQVTTAQTAVTALGAKPSQASVVGAASTNVTPAISMLFDLSNKVSARLAAAGTGLNNYGILSNEWQDASSNITLASQAVKTATDAKTSGPDGAGQLSLAVSKLKLALRDVEDIMAGVKGH